MKLNERMAIVETKVNHIVDSVDALTVNMDLLLRERHESIGRKSAFGVMYAGLGALMLKLIETFVWFK